MNVADYITHYLYEQYNVKYIFMLSGGGSIYLDDSVAKHPYVKDICVRNEITAPMMANGYTKAGGKLGVIYVTTGPGSANAIAGLVESWADSCPVLVVSGQVERDQTVQSMRRNLRSYGTQELNVEEIVKPIVKEFYSLYNPRNIKECLDILGYLAMNDRKGPVWLEVPLDVQKEEIDIDSLKGVDYKEEYYSSLFFNKDCSNDIKDVIDSLLRSKKPLIVAGQGVKGAIKELKSLLDYTEIPIIFSRMGLDLLPYQDINNLGLGGIKGRKYNTQIMKEADFILALGTTLSPAFCGSHLSFFNKKAMIAIVDNDFEELHKFDDYEEGNYLIWRENLLHYYADTNLFLKELNKKLVSSEIHLNYVEWIKDVNKVKRKNKIIYSNKKHVIDIYDFFLALDEVSQENDVFVTDAGSCYYVAGQTLEFNKKGQKDICSGAYASMGNAIPLAIGAALQNPNSRIITIIGDGSIETNIQELKTLSYYGFNVKVFVMNNGGYISMRDHQDKLFNGRYINSNKETGNPVLNFKDVAKAFGLSYENLVQGIERKIKFTMHDIKSIINSVLNEEGPTLVEVMCDPNQKLIEPVLDEE